MKFPETPLILAGALGGPTCIFLLTPLRNALTLASQDTENSALELYRRTFQGGITSGWTGGMVPVIPSCPQFCVMGPLFHFLKEALGGVVPAVLLSAVCETCISYGSQTLNAQLAFNRELEQLGLGSQQVSLWNPLVPFGPGSAVHVCRNVVALSGIRVFSGPCQRGLVKLANACGTGLPEGARNFLGDFAASIGAAIFSAPLNQLYNFAVTSESYMAAGMVERVGLLTNFMVESYLVFSPDGAFLGLSATLARDLFMRCAYVASLYSCFGAIERAAVVFWRQVVVGAERTLPIQRRKTVGVNAMS